MKECGRCKGTGLLRKGIWIFARSEHCDRCGGSGKVMEDSDRNETGTSIDGDPMRMQQVFHVMAKARKLAQDAEKKGKRTFDVHNNLKKAQRYLREKDYDTAMEKAQEALEHAQKLS